MIKVKRGMKALVVGLQKSGVSATKLLVKKGLQVTVTDDKNKSDLYESLEALEGVKYRAELGKHVLKTLPGVCLNEMFISKHSFVIV